MSTKVLSACVLCGLILLAIPSGRAQSGTPASGLVGSWELTLRPNTGEAPKAISGLATFASDGTVIETDTNEVAPMAGSAQLGTGRERVSAREAAVFGTPGHGIWQPSPVFGSLFIRFTSLFANPDSTLHSKRIVTMTVTLNSTGDQFGGGYSFVVLDPTGRAITTGSGTVTAQLMTHPLLP
jgi:hypothetical protein